MGLLGKGFQGGNVDGTATLGFFLLCLGNRQHQGCFALSSSQVQEEVLFIGKELLNSKKLAVTFELNRVVVVKFTEGRESIIKLDQSVFLGGCEKTAHTRGELL